MKKLILTMLIILGVAVPAWLMATTPSTKLPLKYRAVYCYPTGTYWQKQIAKFPDYYAANDASYQANYGANTQYCPAS